MQGSSPLFTYAEQAISSKVHKMIQYACAVDQVVLYGVMKVNMTKSHFNLLQLILVRILCDRHHILKIIVECAYYTSITRWAGLKRVQLCVEVRNENGVIYLGGEHKTKLNYSTYQTKFKNDRTEMKLHGEYDYKCIRNSLSSYAVLSR